MYNAYQGNARRAAANAARHAAQAMQNEYRIAYNTLEDAEMWKHATIDAQCVDDAVAMLVSRVGKCERRTVDETIVTRVNGVLVA